jgi:exopolysaccharide biosynthesis polyprenyl glycosylphosphotransferase
MNGEAVSLATQLDQDVSSGFQVLGIVSPGKDLIRTESSTSCQFPWLGAIEDIPSLVQVLRVREVIVAASSVSREDLLRLFERLQPLDGVTLRLSTGLYEVLTTGIHVRNVASIPLVELGRLRLNGTQLAAKTVFEYFSTLIVLILSLPVFIIVALLVKLASPGPLIYRRRVVGIGGKEFDAFKFRTMSVNGDQVLAKYPGLHDQLNRDGKLKDDPRVTRVGRFLRRYSLDELPQLLNVLRGEMSLVGPRMITRQEAQQYGPHKLSLLTVKPGITGLWQVSGRSELSYADRVRLDIHYIRNYSLWMDLQILLVQTPSAVLRGRGAY